MNLIALRISTSNKSTIGAFYIDEKFECYTMEDTYRPEKVKGETRIPAGTYDVEFRKTITEKTESYRKRHSFFTWHLHIKDVPNYTAVYIHAGNTPEHTEGCLLLNNIAYNNQIGLDKCGDSRTAFETSYRKISKALNEGERVKIGIVDYDKI